MKIAFITLLCFHGVLHVMGFVRSVGAWRDPELTVPISRTLGVLWLMAALGFWSSAWLFVKAPVGFAVIAGLTSILSQTLIVLAWRDAKVGTLFNLVVLVPVVLAMLEARPSSFRSLYRADVQRGVPEPQAVENVTESDLSRLPELLQKYLRRVDAVGKSRVYNFEARFAVQMKRSEETGWVAGRAEQYNSFDPVARSFLMRVSAYGVPFEALHRYVDAEATMKVKVLSLFEVVDARGPEMNQSETVTLFNDLCLLAPAALIDAPVTWQVIDERTLHGAFTNAGHTVSALLTFDPAGDLSHFVSYDRYQSADGKTYEKLPWSTPIHEYGEFAGRRVVKRAEASWQQPGGDYTYARFELEDIEYNVRR